MADAHSHSAGHPTDRLVGTAPAISALRAQTCHLASFDTVGNPHVPTVLLQGETGTGKGLMARVIHDSGPRAAGPFVEVNCAAIPDTMLEAELFGFEPGAFTDAKRPKPGLFEAASGGTLFLDEIDALPLTLQSKLLTAIESKQVRRLGAWGSGPTCTVDWRVWCWYCRRCGHGARISWRWPRRLCSTIPVRMGSPANASAPRPRRGCTAMPGRGMCANCAT
jgi:transcriptional regulator with PAS, ATPase and Fis domain